MRILKYIGMQFPTVALLLGLNHFFTPSFFPVGQEFALIVLIVLFIFIAKQLFLGILLKLYGNNKENWVALYLAAFISKFTLILLFLVSLGFIFPEIVDKMILATLASYLSLLLLDIVFDLRFNRL